MATPGSAGALPGEGSAPGSGFRRARDAAGGAERGAAGGPDPPALPAPPPRAARGGLRTDPPRARAWPPRGAGRGALAPGLQRRRGGGRGAGRRHQVRRAGGRRCAVRAALLGRVRRRASAACSPQADGVGALHSGLAPGEGHEAPALARRVGGRVPQVPAVPRV